MRDSTLRLLQLFLLTCPAVVFAAANVDPLFASQELLEARLVTPVARIMRDRPIEEYVPGTFSFTGADGEVVEFEAGVRTRGNFRRKPGTCKFAPLRLNFKKSQTKDTLFDKQDKLKLVTHCQNDSWRYQRSVLREYLAYRVLNLLTDESFRVRLLRITYVDNEKDDLEIVSLGILIENSGRLAKRIDTPALKIDKTEYSELDPGFANLISVFHYFIANTDFSQIRVSPGDDCCHNHTLFGNEGTRIISIPYDFDMSGFVSAPHSQANPRFRLRSVRQRLYRGRCTNNKFVLRSVQRFFDEREQIYELILNENAEIGRSRSTTRKFVDQFYAKLNAPKKIEKELLKKCI